ncbi:MAG TPA: DUF2934 domain-containing protein [Blastocatellia bacterium]|nr:DUF2934 domain-containing protein [Blastocatellia bacterium]
MARPGKSKKVEEGGISSQAIEQPKVDKIEAATNYPTYEEIRLRAYEIYLERGGGDGNDADDWLQAERELGGGSQTQEISE